MRTPCQKWSSICINRSSYILQTDSLSLSVHYSVPGPRTPVSITPRKRKYMYYMRMRIGHRLYSLGRDGEGHNLLGSKHSDQLSPRPPQAPGKRRGGCLLSWPGRSPLIIEPNNAVRETETQLMAIILVPRKPCTRACLLFEWVRVLPPLHRTAAPASLLPCVLGVRACVRQLI